MGQNSAIEWTDHTFNPWIGCAKVSPGCQHCYAETLMDTRYGRVQWGVNGTRVRTSAANWKQPLKWNRQAEAEGVRRRVFCASLADVFEDRPELHPWRTNLFELIAATQHLDWLLLTKRPENVIKMVLWDAPGCKPSDNVWFGTSAENQEQANKRIPELLRIPAAVRFLSVEPLLGKIEFSDVTKRSDAVFQLGKKAMDGIHWVIVGGESGHGARPMHPDWARGIRDQCQAADVSFFFKQWGEWWPAGKKIVERSDMVLFGDEAMYRVGKHAAGRLLDGREWNEYPAIAEAQR